MKEEFSPIIPDSTQTPVRRFPIVMQLGVLAVILFFIFGALMLPEKNATLTTSPELPPTSPTETTLSPQKFDDISLTAKAAYVWDIRAQRALFSKNADESLPLASITKLMTALLAYELVADDTKATISAAAVQQEGSSGLSEGERLSIEQLRELTLISSSNDAAFALAASVGALLGDQDPTAQFIRGMNIRAEELNLHSLEFWNTTGLDLSPTKPGAVGSARDVSFLMEYIITHHPEVIAPTQETSTRVYNTAGSYHEVSNTNQAATQIPNMIGSKTGFTDLAGGNLTVAFDAGFDRPIVITVLGSTRDDRFTDVLTLVQAVQRSMNHNE
jgi:D-alanyl-D-alanine carboxypeptidase